MKDHHNTQVTGKQVILGLIVLIVVLSLAAAWRWTSLGQWLEIENLEQFVLRIKGRPTAPLFVIGVYIVASLAVAPITVVVIASLLVFGSIRGYFYSFAGLVVSAVITYGLGHLFGHDLIRRLPASRAHKVSRYLARQGLLTMIFVRLVPLAPFTIINMIAGASHIRFRDYTVGTILGIGLNTLAFTIVIDQLEQAVQTPGIVSIGIILGVLALMVLAALIIRHWWFSSEKVEEKA